MSGFSGSGAVKVLAQSAAAVSHTGDTVESTLATVVVPANAIGPNGQVIVEALFSMTNNANVKTAKFKFGATTVLSVGLTSVATAQQRRRIANRGLTNSQVTTGQTTTSEFASGVGTSIGTAAEDTTAAVTILITGTLATNTDTITLESYQVLLYPKG